MKSTTHQQKLIFSVKIFACALILGMLGWLSFLPPAVGAAADVILSVNVSYSNPSISASSTAEVGRDVPISGVSNNVESVEVYLDVNGDGILDAGDIKLDGTVDMGDSGAFAGTVYLPEGLADATYGLIVVGHTAQTGGGAYPETVQTVVSVHYVNNGPKLDCIYNKGSSCSPISSPDQAFGSVNDSTTIVIDGSNFGDEINTGVTVGGQECEIVSINSTQIVCVVPPAKAGQTGPQNVTICVNGLCSTRQGGFVYYSAPLPGVPGTGLFRAGETVVTAKDIMWWGGLVVILAAAAMLIMIIKAPKKTRYSANSGASKKRNTSKKKVAFSSSKKAGKSKKTLKRK